MKTISQWLLTGGVLAMAVACQPQKDKPDQGQNGGCRASLEKPVQKSTTAENKQVAPARPIVEKKAAVVAEPKAVEVEKVAPSAVAEHKPVAAPAQSPAVATDTTTESSKHETPMIQVQAASESPATSSAPGK